jgi:hypothetical protein
MKSNKYTFLIMVMIVCITACKSRRSYDSAVVAEMKSISTGRDYSAPPPPPPPPPEENMASESAVNPPEPETNPSSISRKIIKDGQMEIKVKKLELGKIQIDSLVKKFQGYYAGETYNNQDYSHDFTLKIRIPSDKFELFIAQAESGMGEVIYKNISSRDVTEEFIDLETRLKSKRNYLTRYGELLKQAKSVKDILEIEEKTRGIEEEIESSEGRLKYLNNQVNFSTLELRITKKNDYNFIPQNEGNFFDRLKFSLAKGWFGFVTFTLAIIRLWPFWIIIGLFYYLIRKILHRRKVK